MDLSNLFTITEKPQPDTKVLLRNLNNWKPVTIPEKDKLPAFIIEPNIKKGPWIAGGAALLWYQRKYVGDNDIDVFCKDKKQADDVIRRIIDYSRDGENSMILRTKNATTISFTSSIEEKYPFGEWKIQVITCKYFDNVQQVIDSFDMTVCQVATCGYEWILGPKTAADIKAKNIRFNTITPDSPKRLTKYWVYGYTPVEGTIEAIVNNPNTKWNYSEDEDYANII